LVALTSVIGGIHFVRTSGGPRTGIDAVVRGPFVESTWADYASDCGFKSFLGNPIHVTMAFKQKYENKTVRWEGEVHHVEDGLTFLMFNQKGSLYMRMFPAQFPKKPALPDLVLLYNDGDPVAKEVLKTKRGMNVSFDATMVEVGKRGNPHVMVLWELRKLSGALAGAPRRTLALADAPASKEGRDDSFGKSNRSSDIIIQPP